MAEKKEAPVRVEVEFGAGDDPAVHVDGTDLWGRPSSLSLRGRVDRVDRTGDGEDGALKVLDYKSGGIPPAAGHRDGSVLQTALYREAAESLLGRHVDAARYRSIRSPGSPANGASLSRAAARKTLAFALEQKGVLCIAKPRG